MENRMHDGLLKLYVIFQNLLGAEDGQDLVEYMLLCSLIALAMIAGLNPIATAVGRVFANVSSSLS